MNIKECAMCYEPKVKIASERDGRGRYVYRDTDGRRWAGPICPDCKTSYSTAGKKNSIYQEAKTYSCRCCGVKTINRFMCTHCHNVKQTSDYQFTEYAV